MAGSTFFEPSTLASLATRRTNSLFERDYFSAAERVAGRLEGSRVLVIGGAGSIGASVTKLLAGFAIDALHVVDLSENALVELTRDLRSSPTPVRAREVRWLPLDFGSPLMERWLVSEAPYQFVLNFAALKHVRSEKQASVILRMLDVNVLRHVALLEWLAAVSPGTDYFAVSTDKAANPVNLMGASKRLMEYATLSGRYGNVTRSTSARFANVAFSDGSLLSGWTYRMAKGQPLAVPQDTKRYFVSLEEAGHLCMLAAFSLAHQQILVPRLSPTEDLLPLQEVAAAFVRLQGLEPEYYDSESLAIQRVEADRARARYPVLVTPLDTMGEKPFEEFVGHGEQVRDAGFSTVEAVEFQPPSHADMLEHFLTAVRERIENPSIPVSKRWLVDQMSEVLTDFRYADSDRELDNRA